SRLLTTQTAPSPNAMPVGPSPTSIDSTAAFVPGSIRDTVLPSVLVTQYASAPAATAVGVAPTAVAATRRPERPSTTASELPAADTAAWPFPPGPNPTGGTTTAAAITQVGAESRTERRFHDRRSITDVPSSTVASATDAVGMDVCGASRSAR